MGKGGDSADEAEQQTPSVLADARFAPFQQQNFNVAEFTSRVLAGSHTTAAAQSDQLRDGVRLLEAELSTEVVGRNRELLTNVRRMLEAETSVRDVVLSVESLQAAVRRIRAEVAGPYEQIKHRTAQLRNIHGTVDLLRHVIHRLKLAQKLRAQMEAPAGQQDLAKAAKLITDIRAVDAEVDLSGVEAVAADAGFLESAHKAVQEQAMVRAGLHRRACTAICPCGTHASIRSSHGTRMLDAAAAPFRASGQLAWHAWQASDRPLLLAHRKGRGHAPAAAASGGARCGSLASWHGLHHRHASVY